MKYLLFTLLSFFILACSDSPNIEKLIHKTEEILEEDNHYITKIFDKYILELAEKNTLEYSEQNNVDLKRLRILIKQCNKVISKLENTQNSAARFEIQESYKRWLNQKIKIWGLNLHSFSKDKLNTWKNINSLPLNKYEIYQFTANIFVKLGFEDLRVGTYWGPVIEFLVNTQQVEENEDIELWLSPVQRNQHYYYDIKLDNGSIENKQEQGAQFDIVIPSRKIGKKTFSLEIQAKNFEENLDTTLYFKHQFEVIK